MEYDPDVFRNKVILLPCDDPEWSNFTKFFALHFVDYGIKKLISTAYAPTAIPPARFTAQHCLRWTAQRSTRPRIVFGARSSYWRPMTSTATRPSISMIFSGTT